jgi:cytochrome c peroxidase
MKPLLIWKLFPLFLIIGFSSTGNAVENRSALEALGKRIFSDTRFSNPAGDLNTSCASCHIPLDPSGRNAFADVFNRSWHPWRKEDPGRETLRNSPQLLDVSAQRGLFHLDGEFSSIEEQSEKTMTSRNLGWLPDETQKAFKHIRKTLTKDDSYSAQFNKAFGKSINALDDQVIVKLMGTALAEFMKSLTSPMDSPYDQFVETNELPSTPELNETPQAYGTRVLNKIRRLEKSNSLQFIEGFDEAALNGYRLFLETERFEQRGNCVSCHVPPHFSDFNFHNTGVTQIEFDAMHGEGSFMVMEIPADPALADDDRFKKYPSVGIKQNVDLGHWNFADKDSSPLFIEGDSQRSFYRRTIATFKTPTLRHLGSTSPFTHSGESPFLHDVLDKKAYAAFLSRLAQMRNPDTEIANIFINENDYGALFAFLNALNDAEEPLAEAPPVNPSSIDLSSYNSSNRR